MKTLRTLAMLFGIAVVGSGLARADIQFTGSTSGAFSPAITGLSFAGSGFSALVPIGGGATLNNLGTFTLAPTCSGQNCTQTISTNFTLTFTFTVPTVVGTQQFTASVNGTAKRAGTSSNFNGTTTIDFNNTVQTFSFSNAAGQGSFGLSVNDPTKLVIVGGTSGTSTVTGQISGLTFTPNVAPVPEPAAIGMLSTVIGLTALGLRRRKKA